MNMFRELRADEIDCRISQIKEYEGKPTGLSLLLYKDARCDQNILDETVSPMNWKREHTRDNRNCIVSIWDESKKQWISKEDTGTESNTEKEKGLASDSFKRACFNWGIGRELYTAPFVWIPASKCSEISRNKLGKLACYDNFTVTDIDYLNGNICFLKIKNEKTGKECFSWGEKGKEEKRLVAPDCEPEATMKLPESNADVTKVDRIPPKQANPVEKAFNAGMTEFMERYGVADSQEALKKFNSYRESLQDGGVIPKKKKMETAEEVNATFDAIYKNFKPSGEKK